MKLLVFAHTPPPHHGQSYMVQLMLEGLGGNHRARRPAGADKRTPPPERRALALREPTPSAAQSQSSALQGQGPITPPADAAGQRDFGIQCYHVNARLSKKLEDIGDFRVGKFLLLLGYCLQAIWCRFRYGVSVFYYIPAPGKASALYRDWIVMLLCRPFFKRVVFHWHAAGLGKWLETSCQIRARAATYRLAKPIDLSIVLSSFNRADAEKLLSRQVKVVTNGIPDPCPDFAERVLPERQARFAARQKLLRGEPLDTPNFSRTGGDPHVVKILFLAHCTREKGLFDAMAGVLKANACLAERHSPLSLRLLVTGHFATQEERAEFDRCLADPATAQQVTYFGFVAGDRKGQLLREADLFCFPTYYQNENQPVNLIEAMAFGLPILTTRWRSLPELFPPNYPGLVDIRSPDQVARAILTLLNTETGEDFRALFLRRFTLEQHLSSLAAAFHSLTDPPPASQPAVTQPGAAGTIMASALVAEDKLDLGAVVSRHPPILRSEI